MSSYPLVKYVAAPAVGAVVGYDFNDQAATPSKKVTEFEPGVPTLEGDPDAVGQQWGFRSPQIVHTIKGTKAQAMAALSAVSKEQLRRTNWVLFQPSAAQAPVWFRTYRTGYQPITLDQVYVRTDGGGQAPLPDTWKITVPLIADPFAYGARVAMSTFQVVQSPADLAGPTRTAMRVVLPAIKGDAPAPLRVVITPASTSGTAAPESAWLLACLSGTTGMADTVVDIGTGDGFTAGTGTGAGVADADYFNGSYRAVTISASQALTTQRLTGTLPSLPVGRYKVMLHYEADRTTVNSQPYLFRLTVNGGGDDVLGPTAIVEVADSSTLRSGWVDLGDITYPAGLPVFDETPPGQVAPYPGIVPFVLQTTTSNGTAGTVRIDAFKFIPIGGPTVSRATLLKSTMGSFYPMYTATPASRTGTWDGDTESFWITSVAPTATTGVLPSPVVQQGSYPVADPAAPQNLLIVMATDNGTPITVGFGSSSSQIVSKDAQVAVDVSYYPRFLHVGDGT